MKEFTAHKGGGKFFTIQKKLDPLNFADVVSKTPRCPIKASQYSQCQCIKTFRITLLLQCQCRL